MKHLLLAFSILFLYNCKRATQKKENSDKINSVNKKNDFDKILKCSPYSFSDNYFMTADYGCIYNPQGENNIGNIIVYLVPKTPLHIKDEDIDDQTKKINNLSINDYKNEFSIYLYVIDSMYLFFNKSADPVYYQKKTYLEKLYTYDAKANSWIVLDSIKILNDGENLKEQKWRENFINRLQNDIGSSSEIIDNIPMLVRKIETQGFSLFKEQLCDLNQDKNQDEILIFKNNKEYNSSSDDTKISPVIILINTGNDSYLKEENYNIYPNDFDDFFDKVAIKENFFTIELSNEVPDNYTTNKYITFKYDKETKNILLHKYGEIITWNNGKIDKYNYSESNFGNIFFKDYTSKINFKK